jgi:NarL family two-component system response regulator LiaR
MTSSSTTTIKVMIVDDHDVLRNGLAVFLSTCDDMELVGEAANGLEAVQQCETLRPDVILMDLVMPEMDGVTATRLIRQRYPDVRIVALTSFDDGELVQAALQAGALSYLLKNISAAELVNAIRAAHSGKATLSPEAAQVLISTVSRAARTGSELTGREQEVLSLMAKGLPNHEIAQRLSITHFTVKKHVSNILAKLSVSSRTEAVAFAIQHRLVSQ